MIKHRFKPLIAGLLAVGFLAACASPSTSTSTQASAAASGMQKGRIVAVEPVTAMGAGTTTSSMGSSGASSTGTTMAGSPSAVVTVQFAGGGENRYAVTQQKTKFKVGDPVSVIMNGDNSVIMSP